MNIIIAVLLLGFLVAVHEFGHFVVAKISGMYVETFSIGMGPKIASFQKGETEYTLSAIPAGGFVSVRGISGSGEDEDPDDPRLFQNRPIIHRLLFVLAGPAMNMLLALLVLLVMYMNIGANDINPESPDIIAEVNEASPAFEAGLRAGDKITSVNGKAVKAWTDMDAFMETADGSTIEIGYLRDGEAQQTALTPSYSDSLNHYALGVTKKVKYVHVDLSFKQALTQSTLVTAGMSTIIFDAVLDLVTGRTAVNDEEGGLSGPVGIVNAIGDSVEQGAWVVVSLLAVLSVNFGILNMLPVPGLDGSRFLFITIEAIRGIPISQDKEMIVNFIGMLALMALMIYVTYNDILRVIN